VLRSLHILAVLCAIAAIGLSLWATGTQSTDEWLRHLAWVVLAAAGLFLFVDILGEEFCPARPKSHHQSHTESDAAR
jgi:ABC-type nickel/cobalt efflux system permease component RcnA